MIALVRHGQTDWNLAGKLQGSADIPLNDTGRRQARDTVSTLARTGTWVGVTTSPLSRARETGAILAEGLGIPLLGSYAAFREQEYGAAEGLPQGQLDALLAAGNVPGMETPAQVAERGLAELGRLRHEHAGAIIVVSHGGTIRRIISTLARLPRQDIPRIDNLGISLLADDPATTPTMDNPAGWQVETINGIPLADAVTHTEG